MKILPGKIHPLGAHWDGEGVNFALYSRHAEGVQLCLFDSTGDTTESKQIPLKRGDQDIWSVYVKGLSPGQLYGYRVSGPWSPQSGDFFNPRKVLLDPYARLVARETVMNEALFGPRERRGNDLLSPSETDSAPFAPLAAVCASEREYDWAGDTRPDTPWSKTLIYEAHVKGLTARHPKVPPELRGTYLGLCSKPLIEHLHALGVTAVELLPVHQHTPEWHLYEKGLVNYWGYYTLNFFAPDLRYAVNKSGSAVLFEFKEMVHTFHRAGIEVILDVVYNHTAEANPAGPLLSFRGIDNRTYYRLDKTDGSRYVDFTGCGNTLDCRKAPVTRLVLDSLRYWVEEMHVDGFRFDLASALVRNDPDVDMDCGLLTAIYQDPILNRVKLIAEPWDCGWGGYQVGNFPSPWREWNGQYRDTVRMFWRGDGGKIGALAGSLTGSSSSFQRPGRNMTSSVNFITAHDGFTLHDLVRYADKHNEKNLEENRDGDNNNHSWNGGVEGPSADPQLEAQRERMKRNLVATLALSFGVPMLLAGDELSKTQQGNNNAYCQDNELNWHDWKLDDSQRQFLEFTQKVFQLRKAYPVFQRLDFFRGQKEQKDSLKDIAWYLPDGGEIGADDWGRWDLHCLTVLLSDNSESFPEVFLLIFHAGTNQRKVRFPQEVREQRFQIIFDTARSENENRAVSSEYEIIPQSVVFMRRMSQAVKGSE
jgi:glycogen operon protein